MHLASLALLLVLSDIQTADLCVSLAPDENAPSVVLTIENCGSTYVVISPTLLPAEGTGGPDPWTRISLVVRDQAGQLLPRIGALNDFRLRHPQPHDYLILAPAHFYGQRISLVEGPFSRSLTGERHLRIEATVESSARSWLLQKHGDTVTHFGLDRVFEGSIFADSEDRPEIGALGLRG